MIYLDTAAIIKLIRPEKESAALHMWLGTHEDDVLVSSVLAEIEVPRALRRVDPARLATIPVVFARINRVELDAIVRATAAAYEDPLLRSLDAVHLATAHSLALEGISLTALVTYDHRLLEAAEAVDVPTASPGMSRNYK